MYISKQNNPTAMTKTKTLAILSVIAIGSISAQKVFASERFNYDYFSVSYSKEKHDYTYTQYLEGWNPPISNYEEKNYYNGLQLKYSKEFKFGVFSIERGDKSEYRYDDYWAFSLGYPISYKNIDIIPSVKNISFPVNYSSKSDYNELSLGVRFKPHKHIELFANYSESLDKDRRDLYKPTYSVGASTDTNEKYSVFAEIKSEATDFPIYGDEFSWYQESTKSLILNLGFQINLNK